MCFSNFLGFIRNFHPAICHFYQENPLIRLKDALKKEYALAIFNLDYYIYPEINDKMRIN
jgi:hypothetical protein